MDGSTVRTALTKPTAVSLSCYMFMDSSKFKIFHNKLLPVVLSTCTYVELSNTSTETTLLGSPSPELQPVAWICCKIRGGVRISQVKPSNCFSRLIKLVLPFILTQVFHLSWCETCRVIQQQFWMKDWHFRRGGGSKHTLTIPTYFQGVRTPSTPIIYAPDYRPPNTATVITTNLQEG